MSNIIVKIEQHRLIAIIRGIYGDNLIKLSNALYNGGIRLLEITFNQAEPDCLKKTAGAIAELNSSMAQKMLFGAGTVLNLEQAAAAMDAGAHYIISPNTDEKIIRFTKENGMISIPGAMTPSEMCNAVELGADFVKVFPAAELGCKYMSGIMSPLNHIKFLAVGGVNEANLQNFLSIGYKGAGIGSYLSDKKLIEAGKFDILEDRARNLVKIADNSNPIK